MGEDERNQEEQKKSGIDNAHDLVDNARTTQRGARNLYKGARKLNKVLKAARAARTAAAGVQAGAAAVEGAVATAPVWGTAAVVALIILIIVLFIIVFSGGDTHEPIGPGALPECATIGGACSSQTTCSDVPNGQPDSTATCTDSTKPTCCVPPPPSTGTLCQDLTPANPATALLQDWNVVVRGTSNIANLTTIYKIFCSTNSSNYKRLLKRGGNTLYIDVPYCTSDCISGASINNIRLNGFFSLGLPFNSQRKLLIHESGHVICRRNGTLCNQFSETTLARLDGTACYQYNSSSCLGYFRGGNFLKSYSLRYYCQKCWGGITAHNESFAEAIANYLFTRSGSTGHRCSITIYDVQSQCKNTNNWVKTNIYDGI